MGPQCSTGPGPAAGADQTDPSQMGIKPLAWMARSWVARGIHGTGRWPRSTYLQDRRGNFAATDQASAPHPHPAAAAKRHQERKPAATRTRRAYLAKDAPCYAAFALPIGSWQIDDSHRLQPAGPRHAGGRWRGARSPATTRSKYGCRAELSPQSIKSLGVEQGIFRFHCQHSGSPQIFPGPLALRNAAGRGGEPCNGLAMACDLNHFAATFHLADQLQALSAEAGH